MRNQIQNNRACSSRVASPGCRRRGFTLVEMMVAGVLLMTVSMIVVPAIYWVHRERRETERRQIAIVEVENLMERVVSLPFDEVQQSTVDKFALSETAIRQLPDASLQITVRDAADVKQMKKIRIQLGWKNQQEIKAMPVRLTSWVSPKEQE
ncbi:type II secretion system protein [Gimesia algae]|uniref:type II secretion system protein n=1 Tax=Gimesia algae TaxID=2527971 RepID=UPI0011A1A347|nr:prepilin-type N-terminal cleavage/methylation domain-containing protein [Gimesia algae]